MRFFKTEKIDMSLTNPYIPIKRSRKNPKPNKIVLVPKFSSQSVFLGSVAIDLKSGLFVVAKREFKLTPSEARIVAMFIEQDQKGSPQFSAKTAAELLGYGSANSFRSQLSRLREKLGDFWIANPGGFSVYNPYTIYADSLLISDCKKETGLYSFNRTLAHMITGQHILNDQQLQQVQIQVHPDDVRFRSGLACLGNKPNRPTLVK